ncbi:MAG: response regulator [Pseudomonadota bacterium]
MLLVANAQDKGLELIINYPSTLPAHFIGDAGRIRQVLTNLVGNAIKFTAEGYVKIDVDVTKQDGEAPASVTIAVTDTGIGIPPDAVDAVFDKFTQADGSTTRVYGGTGLGLAITKRICEMMDGRIELSSEVGVGSTFSVNIPLKVDRNAQVERFDVAALTGRLALIVDDIDVNRTILSDQLAGWGMQSHAVSNGVEAAEALKDAAADPSHPGYDVMLLDYLMPGVNGRELASMLSKQSSVAIPPIVMLSSCDQSVTSHELSEIGIETYLVKPVRERRLFETIGRMFAKRDQQSRLTRGEEARPPADATAAPAPYADESYSPIQLAAEQPAAPSSDADALLDSILSEAGQPNSPVEATAEPAPADTAQPMPSATGMPSATPATIQAAGPESQAQDAPGSAAPEPATTEASAPQQDRPAKPLGKQEILVAEDFPLNRDVVRLMLVDTAFEPVFAENGKIASDMFVAQPDRFPLILMDVSMPVMDGYEATQVVRKWEAANGRAAVPIVALTGHALKNDRQECLDAGMSHYLTKPVKQAELLEVLERFTGRAVEGTATRAA